MPLYFAYGSNMDSARLLARVASARPLGAARLPGFAWRCNKRGKDGTGKANLMRDERAETWGVLYDLDEEDLALLDRVEGGYDPCRVTVWQGGAAHPAVTYVSERTTSEAPAAWYLAHILAGAREHALPAAWIARLEATAHSATRSAPSKAGT